MTTAQKNSPLVILGIDPGLETTGFGVIWSSAGKIIAKDFGVFRTSREHERSQRLSEIAADFEAILDLWNPTVLAIEKLIFVKNVSSGLFVAEARGVILEKAAARRLQIVEFLPTEVKQRLTGNGHASKEQMARMIRLFLQLPDLPRPDDAADALALAVVAENLSLKIGK